MPNPKLETIPNAKNTKVQINASTRVLDLHVGIFEIVSDLDIRVSNLNLCRGNFSRM